MRVRSFPLVLTLTGVMAIAPLSSEVPAPQPVDAAALARLEAAGRPSQVMTVARTLSDVYGPRLTGTPALRAAAEYAVRQLTDWGAADAHLEPWTGFGQGWTNEYFAAHMVAPRRMPLIGVPRAWTPGTTGIVTAPAALAPIESAADMDRWRGRLRDTIVLSSPPREVAAQFDPPARRFSDRELEVLQQPPEPGRPRTGTTDRRARRRRDFYRQEGVLAVLSTSAGSGGTLFVMNGASPSAERGPVLPEVVLAVEHYGRLARLLERGVPVQLELEIRNRFHDADPHTVNVIADLPGTDKRGELVMIGAHLDSWHAATGATDNAAGVAVVMEAMRLLKASGLPLRRTVRVALWSGEEQGLLGSRAHVARHFADRRTMARAPGFERLSVYFNVDNGTGLIRGVYLQDHDAVAPIFAAWMQPFAPLGMRTLARRSSTSTDHYAFDEVGLPGFQFVQDAVEYHTRTHHTNMDTAERLQEDDLTRNALIVAAFALQAANADAMLPRKQPVRVETTP